MADQEKDLRRREDELWQRTSKLEIRESELAAKQRNYDSLMAQLEAMLGARP
ncbi:MAG: hypothetical protein IIA72_08630 [Proteobacteria bacterium]|nr:hypothetical protein [Pseudomonadota bacterium]